MSGNVGLVTNKGSWNALTNAPAISNSTRNNSPGDYYTTSVAGTSSFTSRGKGQYFAVGDIVVFNGAVWSKNDQFSVESGFGTPANWKDAYDNHITSGTFANNVITLYQKDGGSFTIDLAGVGGSSLLYNDATTVSAINGQNAFTLSASIDHEDKTQVFIDGVYQQKSGYSVSGTTLAFNGGVVVPQYSTVEIISFSSVSLTDSLADAKVFIGNSSSVAIAKTISGDATLANTGALTLNTSAKTTLGLNNVDNTSDANKPVSTATQTALDLKANIASPTFTGTVGGITKAMVGLSNVDNTTDANKPISSATQTELDLKSTIASPTFTGTVGGITKAMVGLANAENTTDLLKPVSTATQNALNLKANLAGATFTGNVIISGNLQVDGTETIVNTETVEVEDNILQLNTTQGSPDTATATTSGISIYRGDGVTQASFIFDDADDTWDLTNNFSLAGAFNQTGGAASTFSGNVGIGTTSPNRLLDVDGVIGFSDNDVEQGYISPTSTGTDLTLKQSGSNVIRFDSRPNANSWINAGSGGVGIGTASPGDKLEVNGNILLGTTNKVGWRYSSGNTSYNFITGEDQILTLTGGAWTSSATQVAVRIKTQQGQKVSVLNSGNMGIGTTNPLNKFVVAEGTNQHGVEISPGTLSYIQAYDRATGDYGNLQIDSEQIAFGTNNGTVRLTISSGGLATFSNSVTVTKAINLTNSNIAPTGGGIYQGINLIQIRSGTSGFTVNNNANTIVNFRVADSGAATFSGEIDAPTASFTRLEINATNVKLKGDLLGNVDGAYDIGASGANRPRNLYLSNSIQAADITTTGNATFSGDVKIGNGSTATPSANANDLFIDKGAAESGITILSTAASSLRFGDASNVSIGSIEYNHNSDYMRMIVNNSEAMRITSGGTINLNVMSTADAEGYVKMGRSDGNTSRYNQIKNKVSGTQASNFMKLSVHNGTENSTTDALTLLGNGNVGIGTSTLNNSSRLTLLESAGNGQTLEIIGANSGAGGSQPGIKFTGSSGQNIGGIFADTSSDNVRIQTGGTDRLTITSGGIAKIYAQDPFALRVVAKDTIGDAAIGFYRSGESYRKANIGFINGTNDTFYIGNRENAPMLFHTNDAERMRILSGGQVLIGRTTDFGGLGFKLQVDFSNTTTGILVASDNTSSKTALMMRDKNTSAVAGTITFDGSSAQYNTSSDYRLKENVTPITDSLSRVNQLKPSRYNFIADSDKTLDGFLAHEVQDIIPEAISGEKDALNEDGTPNYQGIDQSKIVPLLTAAIQEQQTIIEDLKSRIETLEG